LYSFTYTGVQLDIHITFNSKTTGATSGAVIVYPPGFCRVHLD